MPLEVAVGFIVLPHGSVDLTEIDVREDIAWIAAKVLVFLNTDRLFVPLDRKLTHAGARAVAQLVVQPTDVASDPRPEALADARWRLVVIVQALLELRQRKSPKRAD